MTQNGQTINDVQPTEASLPERARNLLKTIPGLRSLVQRLRAMRTALPHFSEII